MTSIPVASLAMYDLPALRPAADRLWAAIRNRMRATGAAPMPEHLAHDRSIESTWHDPALVLAQTCGLPLMTGLRDIVRLVATPCYDMPGCAGPLYCSFIVIAADHKARDLADLRGGRAAINGWNSQSGMNALRAVIAPVADGRPFFRDVLVTGAHRASLGAIRSGAADVAAIDCVTYGLLAAHAASDLAGTRVLCRTPVVPGLPLVTATASSDDVVRRLIAALAAVIADDQLATARAALHIKDIAALSVADYAPILAMADGAAALGYPVLC